MKKGDFLGLILVISALFVLGCNKAAPAEPAPAATKTVTPTVTATPTITETSTATPTATCTITPDSGTKFFGFEDNTVQGWYKDVAAPAIVSAAPGTAQPRTDSYSLVVACVFSADNDLVQIAKTFSGAPVNLSGGTLSFYTYVSASMFSQGVFHAVAGLVNYDGTVLTLTQTADIPSSGWFQAVFNVPSGAEYEMIKDVMIGIKNDSGTLFYTGDLYIDDITWP